MPEKDKTIYKISREQAGFTQEQASELLVCSVRALARYEAGEANVPDDLAYRMVRLYKSQYLAVEHLRRVSQVAAEVIPSVDACSLQTATLRLVNRVLSFADAHRDKQLLQIAEDGVISEEEKPLFDEILHDLSGIVSACAEVRISTDNRSYELE